MLIFRYSSNEGVMVIDEKVISFTKIKALVEDSWVLVADPVFSAKDNKLKAGILLYYSKNKEDIHNFILQDDQKLIKHYTIAFTGRLPVNQVFIL